MDAAIVAGLISGAAGLTAAVGTTIVCLSRQKTRRALYADSIGMLDAAYKQTSDPEVFKDLPSLWGVEHEKPAAVEPPDEPELSLRKRLWRKVGDALRLN